MSTTSPIYKFATLRNPAGQETPSGVTQVQLTTNLLGTLTSIVEDPGANVDKKSAFNAALQTYIDSADFIKTKAQFTALETAEISRPTPAGMGALYDNVLVRTLTQSTTNPLFKSIVELLKTIYKAIHQTGNDELRIVLPSQLNLIFRAFQAQPPAAPPADLRTPSAIAGELNELMALSDLLAEAKQNQVVSFVSETEVLVRNLEHANITSVLKTASIPLADAKTQVNTKLAELQTAQARQSDFGTKSVPPETLLSSVSQEVDQNTVGLIENQQRFEALKRQIDQAEAAGVQEFTDTKAKSTTKYAEINRTLTRISGTPQTELDLEDAEKMVAKTMKSLSQDFPKMAQAKKYHYVGEAWVQVSELADSAAAPCQPEGESPVSYSANCELKTPFHIADLRVVEQQSVGYLPGEIAHINNTQAGEKNTRVTRRLKQVASAESLLTEEDVFRETDTQSTEKFSLESEAYAVQSAANEFSINTSVSATYGPVSATIDAGYNNSSSTTSGNNTSIAEATEVVQKIVDRVSNRVRIERSTTTLEEFEETVTHEINNEAGGAKSYVYRWLNKLVRATLKNYGKRLIFQFDVAHPAHYYLSRSIQELPALNLPPDPRELQVDGNYVLSPENITRDNYLAWAAIYKTELEQPPAEKIFVSEVLNGMEKTVSGKLIPIAKGYQAYRAEVTSSYLNGYPYNNFITFALGKHAFFFFNGGDTLWSPAVYYLDGQTGQIPVSVATGNQGYFLNLQIECTLTDDAYQAWKLKTYYAIISAYESLKDEVDTQRLGFDPNSPGLNPSQKTQIIRDELKKETIRKMFRCNPFWIKDDYVVGQEYCPNCCLDSANAEVVRFLESAFDWDNMTWQLHPYFYADKDNWAQILDLSDDDPHFESFLRASFATVHVPVHRDTLKETAAINFVMNNSIANYEVVQDDMQPILQELADVQPTLFTYGVNGEELATPVEVIDLGIFNLPTNLVILECGVNDGVKPIGFPESTDPPTSEVSIPKQYSPAIIADTCSNAQ